MDTDERLDAHLAAALDELLSLVSHAVASGRPELALAANAAVDPLLAFLVAGEAPAASDCLPDPAEQRSHAQH